jgi:acetyl esterase/lipase
MIRPYAQPRGYCRLVAAAIVLAIPVGGQPRPAPAQAFAVKQVRGIAYYNGPDADTRHRLDLYVPRGLTDYPVVVLVHGGGWVMGDKRSCGLYSSVGKFLASQGVGAVLPNYRLSPEVKHPEHVRDVARAVAWTHAHIADHGGRPDRLFLAGHSAGGHLVALLATDEQYLKAEGLPTTAIQGVIGISGIYRIPDDPGRLVLRLNELLPFRAAHGPIRPGISFRRDLFSLPFGHDPQVRADASPLCHVRPGLPPFLLLYAENDLPTLPESAADFHQALLDHGCETCLVLVHDRNHNAIIFRATTARDPTARAMLTFIRQHAAAAEPAK